MAGQIRKSLDVPVLGVTVTVDVNFRIIEIIERVYQKKAELAAADLDSPEKVLRSKVAEVISLWLAPLTNDFDRIEIKEAVMTSTPEMLNVYCGCIQGAVLFTLKYVTADELEKLSKGESLPEETDAGKGSGRSTSQPSASKLRWLVGVLRPANSG
jgi:hypothetical protein